MARMEMRSREAPMEWEREQDRNVPNIFANPQQQPTDSSLLTTTPATSNQQQRPFGFGGAQRESSFASLSSQGSFSSNNNGWGATTPKPFRQDSQLSAGNGAGATTLRQDSFSFGQGGVGGSFSRPQSPNNTASQGFISTSATVIGRDGSRTVAHEGEIMDVDRDHSTAQGARTGSAEPFDMELLRNGVAVGLGTSPRRMLGKTHSSASYRESSVLHGSRTSSMQYRGSGAAGTGKGASFWSDDDNDGEDTNEIEEDDDEDAYGRRGSGRSLAYNMQPRNTGSRRRLRDLDNSERRRSDHVRSPPAQGRVWTENVDLPYIISGYVQVAMNSAFVAMMIYIIYNFITTIQNDVTIRAEDALNRELQIIKNCKTDYLANKCNLPHGPLLVGPCESLLACYTRDTPRIERSAVAAQTFALIFNSFVHTISYKTMAFLIVFVFGALYFSNHAISSYRHNHLIHHHHQDPASHQGLAPPVLSSHPTNTNSMIPAGLKRNDSSHITNGGNGMLLSSRQGSGVSSLSRSTIGGAGGSHLSSTSSSRSLTIQHRGSRHALPDSDNE